MQWRAEAVCREVRPVLFDERSSHSNADWTQLQRTADTYCRFCPVMLECRAAGDASEETGLWGGRYRHTQHSRVKMRTLVTVQPARRPRLHVEAAS
jgi:hypothetical protein